MDDATFREQVESVIADPRMNPQMKVSALSALIRTDAPVHVEQPEPELPPAASTGPPPGLGMHGPRPDPAPPSPDEAAALAEPAPEPQANAAAEGGEAELPMEPV